ncbi:MAG: YlbE-like family protein [bacterium]|nr:YlbE-like family protein [bacterium]
MDIKTQIIVRSNPNIYRFLREESYWYKYLNRDPNSIKDLEKAMKTKYKLTTEDKLEKINQSMSLIHSFMDVLK